MTTKKSFTLLELFICLALIAIASTFLGLKGYALLQNARYSAAVEKITLRLKESRFFALTHNEDRVIILKNEGGNTLLLWGFEGDQLREEKLANFYFAFNKKNLSELVINFYSTGMVDPLGELQIASNKNNSEHVSLNLSEILEIVMNDE